MKTHITLDSSTKKPWVKREEYTLETFKRSNQDTCLTHKPAVSEGSWVQSGDLLTDCASSVGGELSLGQNLLIAYMPWEGYNFEDAILISERLVMDDLYTSVHIERYELETQKTKLGAEEITRNIPDTNEKDLVHLDSFGIVKIGSWVEEGDILVGKITPINKKKISPYQKLLYTILEKQVRPIKDSSLRAPKGIKAKVIDIKYFLKTSTYNEFTELNKKFSQTENELKVKNDHNLGSNKSKKLLTNSNLKSTFLSKKNSYNLNIAEKPKSNSNSSSNKYSNINTKRFNLALFLKNSKNIEIKNSNLLSLGKQSKGSKKYFLPKINQLFAKSMSKKTNNSLFLRFNYLRVFWFKFRKKKEGGAISFNLKNETTGRFFNNFSNYNNSFDSFGSFGSFVEQRKLKKVNSNPNLGNDYVNNFKNSQSFSDRKENRKKSIIVKNIETIHIYLAEKRKIQVGDKMAGRHGNKGIVSQILPIQDMPYLPDGTPIDMVLNPLGVPSRMNVGQIYECLLGLAGRFLGENYKVYSFDEIYGPDASRSFVLNKLYEARTKTGFKWLFDPNSPGKIRLFDGRNGLCFDQKVTVGQAYILRLVHMVDDKIHMRSTGPYSLVTQQPLRGRSKQGGQRLGEMEVWALEGYGAAFTLLEMLTIKSDDMTGRMTLWSNLILNKDISIGTPESFKVLVCELQALCLDIGLFRNVGFHNENKNLREITNLMNLP